MKRFWLISLAVLLIAAVSAPAFAWEFNMTGQHEYRFRYWSRTGANDLFGFAPLQDTISLATLTNQGGVVTPFIGFAGPNYWGNGAAVPVPGAGGPNFFGTGQRSMITRGGFARYESDGLLSDSRLTFNPEIRINQAIRVHGTYNVGGIRNRYAMFSGSVLGNGGDVAVSSGVGTPPFERYIPQNALTFSSEDTIGIGSWEQVRATVQTPIGILSYGMKDFPYGRGLFTTSRLRGSAFVLVVPYGPFRFIPAFWEGYSTYNGVNTYDFKADAQDKATWFGGMLFTYNCADFEFGGGWIGRNTHTNRAQAAAQATSGGIMGADQYLSIWSFYFKYFNGRFFADAGYEWANLSTTYIFPLGYGASILAPGIGLQRPGDFCELYHLMAEVGMMAGPSKVTLMWAQANGPVLNNNSIYSRAQGANPNVTGGVNPKNYGLAQGTGRPGYGWGIDWQNLNPYNYLMFSVYGGGNQTFYGLFLNDDSKGMMSDAYAFGAHADYAVASNLNVWGSYLWAHRLEAAGNFMGMFYNDGQYATAAQRLAFRNQIGVNTPGEAYVPDGHIGWELGLGADWKILEGLTVRTRYAYWQPGAWFQYAYQAVMPQGGGAFTPNGYLGVRDAIQAFEGSLTIDF